MRYVLDACAILALVRNEEGGAMVRQIMESDEHVCLVHAVNFCEVYYDCLRCYGSVPANDLLTSLETAGLLTRSDMDADFWKAAGALKARGRISLADCFAVALAVREDATLLTSDHHEFEPLLATSDFPATITFIR